jgi:protein-disulfide isomerase
METTRRGLLAAAGLGTAGLAGCLGAVGGGGNGGGSGCGSWNGGGSPVDAPAAAAMGPEDAAVTVQAWEDYACPHCQTFALETVPRLEENYIGDGEVRYEHHDLPLPINDWSWVLPSAAREVAALADGSAFFDYSKSLFENQGSYSYDLVASLADDVGVDGSAVREAARAGAHRETVETDRQAGLDAGAQGTPAVFVNGTLVDFADASGYYGPLSTAIDCELG